MVTLEMPEILLKTIMMNNISLQKTEIMMLCIQVLTALCVTQGLGGMDNVMIQILTGLTILDPQFLMELELFGVPGMVLDTL